MFKLHGKPQMSVPLKKENCKLCHTRIGMQQTSANDQRQKMLFFFIIVRLDLLLMMYYCKFQYTN